LHADNFGFHNQHQQGEIYMDNRRSFMKKSAVFSAMMASAPAIIRAQGAARTFKVGLVGAGGRGTGAAANIIEAAKNIGHVAKITAVADFFQDKATMRQKSLKSPTTRYLPGPMHTNRLWQPTATS
jgi:hypothetical protein